MPEPEYSFENGFCEIIIDIADSRRSVSGLSLYLVSPVGSSFIADAVECQQCIDVDMPECETDEGEFIDIHLYFECIEEFIDWIERYYVYYSPNEIGEAQWPPKYDRSAK